MKKRWIMAGLILVLAIPVRSSGFGLCPGIADTSQVLDKGIDYLRTPEFAEAMAAVANGTSPNAPAKLPPEWRSAAENWRKNVAEGGKPRISIASLEGDPQDLHAVLLSPAGVPVDPERVGLDERSCDSNLLFRASIEYRARTGREDAPLLYPHVVRQAVSGIGKTVAAKLDAASRNAKRITDISVRIREAERMGAAECQPRELARTKAEFAVAVQGITEIDFDPAAAELVLSRAENVSASLLAERRYASVRGIPCVGE